MSELARTIVGRLRVFLGNRRAGRRLSVSLPVGVCPLALIHQRNGSRRPSFISGKTYNVSPSGLALIVPVIHIEGHYLVGEERSLVVRMELPDGPLEMQAVPARYERLEDPDLTGYLIGARITEMKDDDRTRYNEFLRTLRQR